MTNISNAQNLSTADIADARRTSTREDVMPDLRPEDRLSASDLRSPNPVPLRPSGTERSDAFASPVPNQDTQPLSGPPPVTSPDATANTFGTAAQGEHSAQLFAANELQDFRSRWDRAQGSFVDEPREAVQQADSLVASVVQRIAQQFADERASLEKQWDRGDNVSTEDLRQALKRYRAFFDRLLSV